MCSVPVPSLSFQLEGEQSRTSAAYPGTKKMSAQHSNWHVQGCSRTRSDIGGAGCCSCCASPGGNFTRGDTTETKVNDSPWHCRHLQMLQVAKVWKDGYCHFGQVPVTAAGCSWSAKWRRLSGQAWEICPSHYQSAGTLGLAQARKWELSWSLAFSPTVISSFSQLLKPSIAKSILWLPVWLLLACSIPSGFLTQSQTATLRLRVQQDLLTQSAPGPQMVPSKLAKHLWGRPAGNINPSWLLFHET